jgi:hypothetical protein
VPNVNLIRIALFGKIINVLLCAEMVISNSQSVKKYGANCLAVIRSIDSKIINAIDQETVKRDIDGLEKYGCVS